MANIKLRPRPEMKAEKGRKRIEKAGYVRERVSFFCSAAAWRIIEAMVVALTVSFLALSIGSVAIPALAFEVSNGVSLTQSTNLYQAYAVWLLPMLFYVLLITAAAYAVLRFVIKKWHQFINTRVDRAMRRIISEKWLKEMLDD